MVSAVIQRLSQQLIKLLAKDLHLLLAYFEPAGSFFALLADFLNQGLTLGFDLIEPLVKALMELVAPGLALVTCTDLV